MNDTAKTIKKYELNVDMIPKIPGKVFDLLQPENVELEPFKDFEDEVFKLGTVLDPVQIEVFANKSKILLTKCKNYAAVIYSFFREAERRLQKTKAEVMLFDSEEEWKKKPSEDGKKEKAITDSIRKAYVDISDKVNEARIIRNKWDALNSWFMNTYRDLESYHNWYKKLYDNSCQKGGAI